MGTEMDEILDIHLPNPHQRQDDFIKSPAKRKVIRAGRRGGKTVGVSILAVQKFLEGHRVLYAAPTMEQIGRFWTTVNLALQEPIKKNIFEKMNLSDLLSFKALNKESKLRQPGMRIPCGEITLTYSF